LFQQVVRYKDQVIILFIIVMVIMAIAVSLNWQKRKINIQAGIMLGQAKQYYDTAAYSKFETLSKDIVAKYLNIEPGMEAVGALADYYYENSLYDKCLEITEDALKKVKTKSYIYPVLVLMQGYCYEQKQEYDYAIKRYDEFIKKYSQHYLVPDVYISLIRCYKINGNSSAALTTEKLFRQKFSNTEWLEKLEL
jgi:tetratricopeptide (TPR) repeat protein